MKLISLRGLYSSLFLCSLLISCKSAVNNQPGTTPVIDLASSVGGGRVVNLSDIATDVRYVKLETSDSSLIGMFPRVFYENERIYVLSVRVIKVFDKNGKFLFQHFPANLTHVPNSGWTLPCPRGSCPHPRQPLLLRQQ